MMMMMMMMMMMSSQLTNHSQVVDIVLYAANAYARLYVTACLHDAIVGAIDRAADRCNDLIVYKVGLDSKTQFC